MTETIYNITLSSFTDDRYVEFRYDAEEEGKFNEEYDRRLKAVHSWYQIHCNYLPRFSGFLKNKDHFYDIKYKIIDIARALGSVGNENYENDFRNADHEGFVYTMLYRDEESAVTTFNEICTLLTTENIAYTCEDIVGK